MPKITIGALYFTFQKFCSHDGQWLDYSIHRPIIDELSPERITSSAGT